MKFLTVTFATFSLLGGGTISAQPADADASSTSPFTPARSEDQLDTLLGPIALYPDTLIAVILPASTVPSDLVLAARYIQANGKNASVDEQGWDESVKSLVRYPELLRWMDENLAWTKQLGDAFAAQPAEVMKAVQRLRARAHSVGSLQDTPQQKVAVEGEIIAIQSAEPDVIYVPRYDPQLVYVERPYDYYPGPFVTFGIGFPIVGGGNYRCDWHREAVWVGPGRTRAVWPSGPNLRPSTGMGHVWVPPSHRFQSVGFSNPEHREIERREIARPYPFGRTAIDENARLHNEHINRPWDRSPEAAVNPFHRATIPQADNSAPSVSVGDRVPATPTPRGDERARLHNGAGEHREMAPGGGRFLSPATPAVGAVPAQASAGASPARMPAPAAAPAPALRSDERRRFNDHAGEHHDAGVGGGRFVSPSAPPVGGLPVPMQAIAPPTRAFVPRSVSAPVAMSAPAPAASAPPQARVAPPQPAATAAPVRQSAPPPAANPPTDGSPRGGQLRTGDGSERYRNRS